MRLNLTDTTFLIPFKEDSPDRLDNLTTILKWVHKHFETHVIVFEHVSLKTASRVELVAMTDTWQYVFMPEFHRTKLLNDMAAAATTPVIVLMDTDCVVQPEAMKKAQDAILARGHDFCWPFHLGTHCVKREQAVEFRKTLNIKDLHNPWRVAGVAAGGIVFCARDKFWAAGGENENFYSWAPEDLERRHRWKTLGYSMGRVEGPLWHMDHFVGPDSSAKHPSWGKNAVEWGKILALPPEQLKAYTETWKWRRESKTV